MDFRDAMVLVAVGLLGWLVCDRRLLVYMARRFKKPLQGMKIVFLGDSIFGMDRGFSSIAYHASRITGATVYNAGFGGCRMAVHPDRGYGAFCMWALAKSICEQDWSEQEAYVSECVEYFPEQLHMLRSLNFTDVDAVVIHYGTNDFTANNPSVCLDNVNDLYDCMTLCGAFRSGIEWMSAQFPDLRIIISLPAYRYWPEVQQFSDTYTNGQGLLLSDYVEAIRKEAQKYGLPVIDCYYQSGIGKHNVIQMTKDGVHHNALGRRKLGRFIGRSLAAIGKYDGPSYTLHKEHFL